MSDAVYPGQSWKHLECPTPSDMGLGMQGHIGVAMDAGPYWCGYGCRAILVWLWMQGHIGVAMDAGPYWCGYGCGARARDVGIQLCWQQLFKT